MESTFHFKFCRLYFCNSWIELHYFTVFFLSRYCPVGRSFFSPDIRAPQRLGDGLESWCGFYQSIRPTQMGLSLNIGKLITRNWSVLNRNF
jgi:hypothetical protein